MPTLNLELGYPHHIKVTRLKAALGPQADCYPIRLWCLAGAQCSVTGVFKGYGVAELERVLEWTGKEGHLVEVLVAYKFLDKTKEGYAVHDWKEHASHFKVFKNRAITAAKQRWKTYASSNASSNAKKKSSNASSNASTCPVLSSMSDKDKKRRGPRKQLELDKLTSKQLIEKYNSETPDTCPSVDKITPARLKKSKEYLDIFPDTKFWTEVFNEYHKSKFLSCLLRNKDGHSGFKPDFDWLLSKGKQDQVENVVKVFEGKYRDG